MKGRSEGGGKKKAVIFAPFWRQVGHVGNLRVDRFIRWLQKDGYQVVVVRAGSMDQSREETWGSEVTVRDPMGLYRDTSSSGVQPSLRKRSQCLRTLAYWIFNPEPNVVWSYLAARHPSVLEAAVGADFILSSNPPESAHVGAWKLSRRLGVPHIVDMRDGWLDEPLKPLLRTSAFKRWREGRLEARILRDAGAVQVTSEVWKELLCERLPELSQKVTILTNAYPSVTHQVAQVERVQDDAGIVLVHAGRFFGSMLTRSPDLLLQPLLDGIKDKEIRGVVKLIGPLSAEELQIIDRFTSSFAEHGWSIECPGSLPRHDLLKLLPRSGGLLLLSETFAAIPCKLFEYIPTGRPILVVTARNSASWRICEKLPQVTLIEARGMKKNSFSVQMYLKVASEVSLKAKIPSEFTEEYLEKIMRGVIDKTLRKY